VFNPEHDRVAQFRAGRLGASLVEDVLLEQRVEGLHGRVVRGRDDSSHRSIQLIRLQDPLEGSGPELTASVAVNHHGALGLAPGDGLTKGRAGEIGRLPRVDRVADDAVREDVLDRAEVELALGYSVMSVSQTSLGAGARNSRWTRSSLTAGPGVLPDALRPFFVVVDQIRWVRQSL